MRDHSQLFAFIWLKISTAPLDHCATHHPRRAIAYVRSHLHSKRENTHRRVILSTGDQLLRLPVDDLVDIVRMTPDFSLNATREVGDPDQTRTGRYHHLCSERQGGLELTRHCRQMRSDLHLGGLSNSELARGIP